MKTSNTTIKVEAELAQEARVLAAKRRALCGLKRGYDLDWKKPENREDLHGRESFR